MHGQCVLDGPKLFHKCHHSIFIHVPEAVTDLVHLRFQFKKPGKGGFQHFADRHALFKYSVLIEITDTDIFCPFDFPFVRLEFSCNNIKKSRFPFSVGSDKSNVFAFQKTEGHIMKNGAVTEAVGKMFNI